jgi:hypothetical protein
MRRSTVLSLPSPLVSVPWIRLHFCQKLTQANISNLGPRFKTFMVTFPNVCNKPDCLSLAGFFESSLMFEDKALSLPTGKTLYSDRLRPY